MKNFVKWYGIIAVIVFSFASCSGGGGGNVDKPDNNSGGGLVGTIVSGATVEYDQAFFINTVDMNAAKGYTNFSFFWEDSSDSLDPLRDYINEPASVTVSGGTVTIKLGTPKFDLNSSNSWLIEDGISISPNSAKVYIDTKSGNFGTADGKYGLFCIKDMNNFAVLCYADMDVTIKGTSQYGEKYDCTFKKGWNYIIWSVNTNTFTSSVSQPNGYKWKVINSSLM